MRGAPALLALLVGLGCGPEVGSVPITELDEATFAAHVQPVVHLGCANLYECHGREGRPLRIYAVDQLRAPGTPTRSEPLTALELAWNVGAFEGIDPAATDLDQSLVLLKPLARDAGGVAHEGDDLWPSRDDPSYRCVRAWLAGEAEPAVASACADAPRWEPAIP